MPSPSSGVSFAHPGAAAHADNIHNDPSPGYIDNREMMAHLQRITTAQQIQTLVQASIIVIAAQEIEQMKDRAHSVPSTLLFLILTAVVWRIETWLQQVINDGSPYVLGVRFLKLMAVLVRSFTGYIFVRMLLELLLFDASTGLLDTGQIAAPLVALILLTSIIIFLQYLADPTPLRAYFSKQVSHGHV